MTKSRASLTQKIKDAGRKTKSITKRSLEWFLIAIGYRPLPEYRVSKCGRLKIDEHGFCRSNWDKPVISKFGSQEMAKRKSNSKLAEACAVDLQLLVRLKAADKDGNCKCVSCGVIKHWSDMQGGHYQGRSVIATKLLEENVHPQCRRCNLRSSTSHVGYTLYMLDMYGKEFIQELTELANSDFKWVRKDIEQLHSEVKEQIECQKQRLGLNSGKD